MTTLNTLVERVKEAAEQGEFDEALRLMDDSKALGEPHGSYHFIRGSLLYRLQELENAITSFRMAIEIGPPLPEYLSNLGMALIERSEEPERKDTAADLEEAIALLEEAVRLGPRLPHTYVNLGSAYLNLGNSTKSAYYLELALELDPTFKPAHIGLEVLRSQSQNHVESEE